MQKDKSRIPYALLNNLTRLGITRFIPDKLYLKIMYKLATGNKLDLENPKKFNEKLQWLKLNDRRDIYTTMCDKYRVRDYIKKTIGEEYLIPLLGMWETVEDIDFKSLPDQFVLKCNHDSGSILICKDKSSFDIEKAKKKLSSGLKRNGYWFGREWPYKNIKPCVIAEKYMFNKGESDLIDYKFYCFNGIPVFCQVICSRSESETIDFFDLNWVLQPFSGIHVGNIPFKSSQKILNKPINLDKMIQFSQWLSKDKPFSRIDFYEVQEKLYFGEITLYPAAGFGRFEPDEWDYKLGNILKLPIERAKKI
ncbi:ATP-grasp fold amidoligase family protein [Gallibacterium genomosp. 1]|uniref:Glycosyl transferase n=1 Tax=Gallibacterium genomosp. 1 TaxID=155515 RepID=A0AB36DYJ0_9PAST|nr:ATP-grasp fold amidoligase family protein [Gallibacterium genomosp. 1]OBX00329.1 glycosyl transferase [Gallibacterium genomosp. 1]OBX00361.1 glycosyl transferase [Gallibacterium genomosp. 1]